MSSITHPVLAPCKHKIQAFTYGPAGQPTPHRSAPFVSRRLPQRLPAGTFHRLSTDTIWILSNFTASTTSPWTNLKDIPKGNFLRCQLVSFWCCCSSIALIDAIKSMRLRYWCYKFIHWGPWNTIWYIINAQAAVYILWIRSKTFRICNQEAGGAAPNQLMAGFGHWPHWVVAPWMDCVYALVEADSVLFKCVWLKSWGWCAICIMPNVRVHLWLV